LTSEFVRGEFFETDSAFSYFGEEGWVCRESLEGVLVVVDLFPRDE